MDVFDLAATLTLDSSDYEKGLGKADGEAQSFGSKLASGLGNATKVIGKAFLAATGAGVAAAGALVKSATEAYANYEQLIGGVETLFKDSADVVSGYAENAYKTAGLSANDYMETVTSFSAALLQSLDGDTAKAAEQADKAITDMSDNANKMGTSMESIQTAYQGFAKQNYTMLDNLKLGYGGTKEEMQRLLEDAEKFSGIKYDISSYSDIVDAIHVVQTEMGITGTTAKEAEQTISGSLAMTKSAWENLLVGLADGNADLGSLIDNVVSSASTAFGNILPVAKQALTGINTLINELLPQIAAEIPGLVNDILPTLVDTGLQIVNSLVTGITENLPMLVETFIGIGTTLTDAFIELTPVLLQAGIDLILQLIIGIGQALPQLVPKAVEAISQLVQGLVNNIPMLITAAVQLIEGLATGLLIAIPQLIATVPHIISSLLDGILSSIPQIIEAGIQLLIALVEDLPTIIDAIVEAIPLIIEGIVDALSNNIPQIVNAGIKLMTALVKNLPQIIVTIVKAVPQIITSIVNAFVNALPQMAATGVQVLQSIGEGILKMKDWLGGKVESIVESVKGWFGKLPGKVVDIGVNLIKGLWQGISNAKQWLMDKISGFVDGVIDGLKSFFGIHSPSTKTRWMGQMLAEGLGLGWNEESDKIIDGINRDMQFSAKIGNEGLAPSTARGSLDLDSLQTIISAAVSEALDSYEIEWNERNLGRMVKTYA